VRRFARAAHPSDLDRGARPRPGSSLDVHRALLAEQWLAGNTNAADLLRRPRRPGYRGSDSLLRHYLHPWRTTPPSRRQATPTRRHPASRCGAPSTREVTRWICTRPDDLDDEQRTGLVDVRTRCAHLDRLCSHVRSFAGILTTLAGEQLNAWTRACRTTKDNTS
jgi:hypothetical protein